MKKTKNGGKKQKWWKKTKIHAEVWLLHCEHNKTLDKLKVYNKDQAVADARQRARQALDENGLLRQQVQNAQNEI